MPKFILWIFGFFFLYKVLPAHETSGNAEFSATFTFSLSPKTHRLSVLDRAKDKARWNGWHCVLTRKKDNSVPTTSDETFKMHAFCRKFNAIVELKAKCGIGYRESQKVTGGTTMDSVSIVISCDGGPRLQPKDDSEI